MASGSSGYRFKGMKPSASGDSEHSRSLLQEAEELSSLPRLSRLSQYYENAATATGEAEDAPIKPFTVDIMDNLKTLTTIPRKTGYLLKEGEKNKNWKKRWFVLEDLSLAYYEDENDDSPKGVIALLNSKVEAISSKKYSTGFCFQISALGRQFVFQANTDEDRNAWIDVVQDSIDRPKKAKIFFKAYRDLNNQVTEKGGMLKDLEKEIEKLNEEKREIVSVMQALAVKKASLNADLQERRG
jgi:hypothetical protein